MLDFYNNEYPSSDPLQLKQYNSDYETLVDALLDPNGEVTVKMAGIHALKGQKFYESLAGEAKTTWDNFTQAEKDAVLTEYYKVGDEIVEADAAAQGNAYHPSHGPSAGGDDHLANSNELEQRYEASKNNEPSDWCFPAGTPIALASGGAAPIETIAPNVLVLAFDEHGEGEGRGRGRA